MSIASSGGELVDGPACRPARYGLLTVADVQDRTDGPWLRGVSTDLDTCEGLFVQTPCPPNPYEAKDTAGGAVNTEDQDPFSLISAYKCATGGRAPEEAWDRAENRLNRGEQRSLERTFWTGEDVDGNVVRQSLGQNPDVVDVTPLAGAVSITDGVALLESAMGDCYPCEPIIHGNRGIGTYLAEVSLVERDVDMLRMVGTGSRVVVGGGYQTSGPLGVAAADGESWMYATGSVKVIRGTTTFVPERGNLAAAIDRGVNDIVVFAERPYVVLLDCCIFAVRVVLQSCGCS